LRDRIEPQRLARAENRPKATASQHACYR
jgi:hypothetical protein